ncbi:MAG: hypothetical protein ACI9YP_001005, partial [Colwellia sp.]
FLRKYSEEMDELNLELQLTASTIAEIEEQS